MSTRPVQAPREELRRPVLSPETRFLAWRTGAHGYQARDPWPLARVLPALEPGKVGLVVVTSRWDGDLPWARDLLATPADRLPPALGLWAEFRADGHRTRILRCR